MRYVAILLMAGLAAGVAFLPEPTAQQPGDVPTRLIPPVATCPLIEEGDRTTTISVISSVDGPGRLSGFAAGSIVGEEDFRTGATGSVSVPAVDVGAVGDATGGLVEMPTETSAAGVVVEGPASLAAESCEDVVTDEAFVSGGSTADGEGFELQIFNPFAGDAVVDLTVTTDAGIESDERFDSVVVPASSVKSLDFSEIVPGREFISVDLETTEGAVLAVARQTAGNELAIWRAVEPGQEWWLPVPPGGETKELVLSTPANTEIDYQVDFYGPDGLVEEYQSASESATLSPHGLVRLSLTADTTDAAGVRVSSTGPVVPTLWMQSDAGLSVTTASQLQAVTWLLPGASVRPGGSAAALILNPGVDPATVTVRSIREEPLATNLEVEPETTTVVNLAKADGYRIESTSPVVALWVASVPDASLASLGIPIENE